jgi:hypothetical protein
MSPSSRLVAKALFRPFWVMALLYTGGLAIGDAIAMTVITRVTDPPFSLWVMVFGTGARYWLLIMGILLVSMYLRPFVANGITRRDFMVGSAAAGATMAVVLALLVPAGHAVEWAVLQIGGSPAEYPELTASLAGREFVHVLASGLAFLASGLAITAGFYRYGGWPGILFLIPGLVPMGIAESLLGLGDRGELDARFVSVAVALLAAFAAIALVALMYQRLMRDVPIRRAAG